jgi:hypothetical protein
VGRAEEGDDDALEELQRLLDHYDDLSDPLDTIGRLVERHLIGVAAGDSSPLHRRIERFIAKIRHDFLDGGDDPMEAYLIHRIVVSHLFVSICMNRAAEYISADELHQRQRMLDEAKKRQVKFLAAFREYRIVREFGAEGGFPADFAADVESFYVP